MVNLPSAEALLPLYRALEAAYPDEGCGLILHGPAGFRVLPLANVYDKYRAVDPAAFPRTARTAYLIDPKVFLTLSREADRTLEQVRVIVHSHADVGAYFSEEDRALAAPDGVALHPGVDYLVVAVNRGRAEQAKLFRFDGGRWDEELVPVNR